MVLRQRYYFEREHEGLVAAYASGAAAWLVDGTKLARQAAAIRPASLITDEPASMLSLTTRPKFPLSGEGIARGRWVSAGLGVDGW